MLMMFFVLFWFMLLRLFVCLFVFVSGFLTVCEEGLFLLGPLRVWEPHSGAGVNILLENGQYPHNSSYEAPCLP